MTVTMIMIEIAITMPDMGCLYVCMYVCMYGWMDGWVWMVMAMMMMMMIMHARCLSIPLQ